jgi:hypothetical protein
VKLTEENWETKAMSEITAFFDERIEKMSHQELVRFERKADKIVADVKGHPRRAHAEPGENSQSRLKASRA